MLCCRNALNVSDLKQTCWKSKENVINRKFNALLINMKFISLMRQDVYNISLVLHFISLVRQDVYNISLVLRTRENIKNSCLTREINFIFIKKHWISSVYSEYDEREGIHLHVLFLNEVSQFNHSFVVWKFVVNEFFCIQILRQIVFWSGSKSEYMAIIISLSISTSITYYTQEVVSDSIANWLVLENINQIKQALVLKGESDHKLMSRF
jgi:hypothetical protein